MEKDLPTLREVAGGTWKKEDELKQLKSEVAVLERKIQLSLAPPEQSGKGDTEQKQDEKKILPVDGDNIPSVNDRIVTACPKPLVGGTSKGIKL